MEVIALWKNALSKKQAVPSFNFSSSDVSLAIAKSVKKADYSCLLSVSERELNFQTMEIVVSTVKTLQILGYPVFLNLDHGKSMDAIKRAIALGFNCIHFDGSGLPLDENIAKTKEIVALCKPNGISVEGEVGKIGGSSSLQDESVGQSVLTDPSEAVRFVKETGVDILACSFGSAHGFSDSPETLQIGILNEISRQVFIPFVLHGGSGLPQGEIQKAIAAGVVKINFNTELRLAWSDGIKQYQTQNPKDIIPVNILSYADSKVETIVQEKIRLCKNSYV